MHTSRLVLTAALAAGVLALAACGAPGSGGGKAASSSTASAGQAVCTPIAGDSLTALTDDKHLQNSDNVIPAFNQAFAQANPGVVDLLDTVSQALDTPSLIALNKAVDIDRSTSTQAAEAFVTDKGLAAADSSAGAGVAVVVGAANFSESASLAEVYAAVLRSAGYNATTQTIGSRETYYPALVSGQVAVVPEYAATLADFVNAKVNGADAASIANPDVATTVAALTPLAAQQGIALGEPSAAQDQNAFAVTTAFAQEHDVSTLSQLAAVCGPLVLAGPPECPQRPFCQIGLEGTYGLTFSEFKSFDFALIGQAVRQGDAAVGLVLSSDPTLSS
ncbi:MAG: glycine/betaine ABC transporter substrate-binding protein [Actinobacteria bacterium]|nr:glycine/betaine ABC transporter substrate-binding protein [Actinomycetota bacterium]MBU4335023.1 glycine/betaine ABC transporter substrate-binding protein [Actinomycetota bacterium]MCG2802550.1 glycine/betaine ABC transporter substrate-binding protein [Cellulomonas sp.]